MIKLKIMRESDSFFFKENTAKINKAILHLLIVVNVIPLVLFLLSKYDIFSIDFMEFIKLQFLSLILGFIDFFIIHKKKETLATYCGLLFLGVFIAYTGATANIGLYIAFVIVPILSSFYYDTKLVIKFSIFSYIFMLLSLYFKYKNQAIIFESFRNEQVSFLKSYISVAGSFTIEFTIVALLSYMRSTRAVHVLTSFMDTVNEKTSILQNLQEANKKVEFKNLEMEITQFNIIQFVAECLGSHDLFTGRHVLHTKEYVVLIARRLQQSGKYTEGLDDKTIALYSSAAFLHDIGKLHIPEGILNKVGKFTQEEFDLMKSHPEEGKKLLEYLPKISDGQFNEIAIQMAYCHHEKWNGSGYPRGISGEEIPLCARIMAAADVLDALISQRLYKEPMTVESAMKVFEESKGTHFEPCIADAVIECKDAIKKIDSAFKQQETATYSEELAWWCRYHNIEVPSSK